MLRLVEIEGREIIIRVPIDALPDAAATAFERHYGFDSPAPAVVDPTTFAREVVHELCKELENGDTLVHFMLDKACVNAAEAGAEGLG